MEVSTPLDVMTLLCSSVSEPPSYNVNSVKALVSVTGRIRVTKRVT